VSNIIRGGLDEVGWGCLAGPVISVVALLRDSDIPLLPPGVQDSKKTTEAQRNLLYPTLCSLCVDVGIGHAWPWEMDQYGPGPALQLSYKRAMDDLTVASPSILYVDGNSRVKSWDGHQVVEPKADNKYKEVSVASIIAKYFRDQILISYARARQKQGLPDYGWTRNKGYGSQEHMDAIEAHGLIVDANDTTSDHHLYLHRLSYCKSLRKKNATR
jgi:ribonuclease HII